MLRLAMVAALLGACGDGPLSSPELPACAPLRDGHWDARLATPGAEGANPNVLALARQGDAVIAAGVFDGMSGVPAHNIARWDGARWSALGDGLPGQVTSLAVDDQGRLWAVGTRSPSGPTFHGPIGGASYLARWDGARWTFVVDDVFGIAGVTAIDGGVAVYGTFFAQATLPATSVALWRDGAWSGTGIQSTGNVQSATRIEGGLCVGGSLQLPLLPFFSGVACWDGVRWSRLGPEIGPVQALARGRDGRWYVGGLLQLVEDGAVTNGIARLEGDGEWHALDGGVHGSEIEGRVGFQAEVTSISVVDDGLVVTGRFAGVGTPVQPAYHLARWSEGAGWRAMTPPSDLFGRLAAALVTDTHTYVGGAFQRIGTAPGSAIATVDSGVVRSLPATTLAPTQLGIIGDIVELSDGMLLAGRFVAPEAVGDPQAEVASLLSFDGAWQRSIEGVPPDDSMAAVALPGGYAVRSASRLYRRYDGEQWQVVTDRPVGGPMVADADGRLFFLVQSSPRPTIVQTTRDDTSFYAVAPGDVAAMTIYDGDLVVATINALGSGQSVYRRRGDAWELMGAWPELTTQLVTSPALGLVAGTQRGTRVWTGAEWRTLSTARVHDMAACADGVVAAIDEGDGGRLAFLRDTNSDWERLGDPRGGESWVIAPTARGIYAATAPTGAIGVSPTSPLRIARWALDDTGW